MATADGSVGDDRPRSCRLALLYRLRPLPLVGCFEANPPPKSAEILRQTCVPSWLVRTFYTRNGGSVAGYGESVRGDAEDSRASSPVLVLSASEIARYEFCFVPMAAGLSREVLKTPGSGACHVNKSREQFVPSPRIVRLATRQSTGGYVLCRGRGVPFRGRARTWMPSPWAPNKLSSSTGSGPARSNQCGIRVSNSAASPARSTRSCSPSTRRSRP